MSTTATSPAPGHTDSPVVNFFMHNRIAAAWGLALIGLLSAGVGIYFLTQVWRGIKTSEQPEGEAAITEVQGGITRGEHLIGAVGGIMGAIAGLGMAAHLGLSLPKPTEAGRRSDARSAVLLAGGLFGLVLITVGGLLLYFWFDVLTKWLDERVPPKDAWKPIAAVLTFLCGAGLAFLAAQPARAEERHNPFLRRLVYSTNVILSVLLLLMVLIVGNVVAALKVPNKLDTTESGLHTFELSAPMKEYLQNLSQPVKAYTTITEDTNSITRDTRRMLNAAEEASNGNFTVRYLSPTLNKSDITTLRNKYPQVDFTVYGILLTTGEDEAQHVFISISDLYKQEMARGAGRDSEPQLEFIGESKLAKELLFLAENKTRAVVYFTTGHGEPEVTPAPPGADIRTTRRSATELKTALDKINIEVKPLAFDLKEPKVPDDASIVAIVEPKSAFSEAEAQALRTYLTTPRPNGKPGKLILATSPFPNPDGKGVAPIGLEGLAAEFGIRLGMEYMLGQPSSQFSYTEFFGAPTAQLVDSGNPIAIATSNMAVVLPNCREISDALPPGGPRSVEPLLGSFPSNRITWFEPDPVVNPEQAFKELLSSDEMIRRKRGSRRTRLIAALVTEGEDGRMVVYGSGQAFLDPDRRNPESNQQNVELFVATVNWLRDRPAVANIPAKNYGVYTPNRTADSVRLFWLPTGITLLGVLAMGLGVWVFRRK